MQNGFRVARYSLGHGHHWWGEDVMEEEFSTHSWQAHDVRRHGRQNKEGSDVADEAQSKRGELTLKCPLSTV